MPMASLLQRSTMQVRSSSSSSTLCAVSRQDWCKCSVSYNMHTACRPPTKVPPPDLSAGACLCLVCTCLYRH